MTSKPFEPSVKNCSLIKCDHLVWSTHEPSGNRRRICGHNSRIPGNMTSCPRGKDWKSPGSVDHTQLKPGMHVIYHSWKGGPGKEHIVDSEPYELHPGQWVVHLKGKSGCVGCDFISDIVQEA